MKIEVFKALTSEKIVRCENVEDFAIRDDHYGNWVLDITYFDDDIEQDISDSMILCELSDENPWTDLILFTEDEEHMEIRASEDNIKMLSAAAAYRLKCRAGKYEPCKTKLNSLYGKTVTEMSKEDTV